LGIHVDGLESRDPLAFCVFFEARTDKHTGAASGAVLWGYLNGELQALELLSLGINGFEPRRRGFQKDRVVGLKPYRRVRADKGALAALNAYIRLPNRNMDADIPLFILRRPGRPCSVGRYRRNRQVVALAGYYLRCYIPYKLRGHFGHRRLKPYRARDFSREGHFNDVLKGPVDSFIVHFDDCFPFLQVGLPDFSFDRPDSILFRKYSRDNEERRLHYHIDPP